jgi:hypothetical protein
MAYKKKTIHFGIPFISSGEKLDSEQERRKYHIIENQLLAANKRTGPCVIREGVFSVVVDENKVYTVGLIPACGIVLEGVINGTLVSSAKGIAWEGLKEGGKYYLYVEWTDKLFEDSAAFRVSAKLVKTKSDFHLLLAYVDLTGDEVKLYTHPEGKIYSSDFEKHFGNSVNPHGEVLTQDTINVNQDITLNKVSLKEALGNIFEIKTFDLVSSNTPIVKEMEVGYLIVCVVVQKATHAGKVGAISVEEYAATSFSVACEGEPGVPLKAIVFCRKV